MLIILVMLHKRKLYYKPFRYISVKIHLITCFGFRMLPTIQVFAIHGKMKNKRYKVFNDFRSVESGILICTDVMARGIDISEVDWVLQYDPPCSASSFVHR